MEHRVSQSELSGKVELQKTQSDMSQTEARIAQSEARMAQSEGRVSTILGGQWFQIFIAMAGLAAALGGIAVWIVQQSVARVVLRQAKRFLDEQIEQSKIVLNGHMERAQFVTIEETYSQISFQWWQLYEPQYQQYLHGVITALLEDGKHHLSLAKKFTEGGFLTLNPPPEIPRTPEFEDFMKNDPRAKLTCAKLLNDFVYHETAELLCDRSKNTADGKISLLSKADECLKLATEQGTLWYNLRETAAGTLIKFGNDTQRELGRQILRDMFNGNVPRDFPSPPINWLRGIWDDYFPLGPDGKARLDLLGLGAVPKPGGTNP